MPPSDLRAIRALFQTYTYLFLSMTHIFITSLIAGGRYILLQSLDKIVADSMSSLLMLLRRFFKRPVLIPTVYTKYVYIK